MDVVSLGFLFLMVLIGGASAFAADWLAWRIGKKRASLWGMRPKHFARLTVTVAGMLIPFVTILLVAGVSRDVREWIVRGNRALRELPQAVEELDQNKRSVANLVRQRGDLRAQNERSRESIRRQSDLLMKGRNQVARLGRQIAGQQNRISAQASRIAVLTPRVAALAAKAQLSASQARALGEQNRTVRGSLRRAQTLYAKESARLATVRQDLNLATANLGAAQKDYVKTNNRNLELTQQNGDLDKRITQLEGQTSKLQSDIAQLESERTTAEDRSREARAQRHSLQEQVRKLQDEADQYDRAVRETNRVTRLAPVTALRGDELSRVVVPAGSSVVAARASVEGLLATAAREAARRGATGEGGASAAEVAALRWQGRLLVRDEQIDLWSTRAAGGKEPRILVARAVANFFAGEPVSFGVELYDSPIAFPDGAVVAEARVDGRRPDGAVYAQVTEFLEGRVNAAARDAKMVPRQENGAPTFGAVDTSELLAIVRQARDADRVVRVQAVAAGAVRAGEPLKIRLRLR